MKPALKPCSLIHFLALLIGLVTAAPPSFAAEQGRLVYDNTCARCHGMLLEQTTGNWPLPDRSSIVPVVVLAYGPTLNGIVGRPVGIIKGYKYSKSMQKLAASGAVWDRKTLDVLLTNSRKFLPGTYMFVKLKVEDRTAVIDYLERYSRYQR